MSNIEKLGFDNWFWESIPSGKDKIDLSKTTDFWESSIRSPSDIPSGKDKIDLSKTAAFQIVRVISVNKNSFVVSNGVKDIYAELTGKFLFNSEDSLDLPAVGDWVYAQFFDEDSLAIIHDILPRKSLLKRKTYGKNIHSSISLTRPTSPVSSRTFIPCGCLGDFVRMSLTIPSVCLPVGWSSFTTTFTCIPIFTSARLNSLINQYLVLV